MRESIFLLRNGVNIYDGGVLQPSPWLLTILAPFALDNFYAIRLIFIGLDLLIAVALYKLTELIPKSPLNPVQVAKCYFYNPLAIFSVFGMNWTLFIVFLHLTALRYSLQGKELITAVLGGFLIHVDFYNLALLAPLAIRSKRILVKTVAFWLILSISSTWLLHYCWNVPRASLLDIIDSVYISRMRIDSLRPNSGMSWYLFAQVFPAFTPLLKMTFQSTLMVFWPACAIKFRSDPVFMFLMIIGSQMILKGYPSSTDYALFFGLMMTQAHVFEQTRVLFIALFVAAGVYVMKMQIWRYWIEVNGFNANFYYIFTLIWNAVLIIIFMDLVSAYNKTRIYEENKELNDKSYEKCKLFQR